MDNSHTLKSTQRTLEESVTLSHTSKHCSMNQLDLTTRPVACLSPRLSTFTHFTLPLFTCDALHTQVMLQ